MRTEQEMFDLILNIARADERIRAVMLNGSRADPNAPRDFFQDFDIIYFVTDPAPFTRNLEWIRRFGELMILQLPDDMADPPPGPGDDYGYLMQFADGNRIDLTIDPIDRISTKERDSQTIVLLDKDGLLPAYPPASDNDYLPKPPTARQFFDCTNEFWWVSPYVAKGLWRHELPYARGIQEVYLREQLTKMLDWYVGVQTDFTVATGKLGKYYERTLEPELWEMLLKTYANDSYERTWEALFIMCDLFRRTAQRVAAHFGYDYPLGDDERVSTHLRHVRTLPSDASEMY